MLQSSYVIFLKHDPTLFCLLFLRTFIAFHFDRGFTYGFQDSLFRRGISLYLCVLYALFLFIDFTFMLFMQCFDF